ncbi:nuclear transport factor 2 family protein [Tropicimonas sp. TH_r6]|uniref:nuclear transport factor 2 family protein n=1 Tax=Tropicimonas sp. TH_r6 TaxID=3082085 RepID=UPI002955D189|nr:nuclear transport factor 2 family protein [Tropicimonas sp. TH_r6]MDV7141564.1 nuclear transport factor 2 family protein [Tropicimonas sp. TH_r6]
MGNALENVRNLYLDGIAGGNAREAVLKYTGHRYTQHSTGVGDGAEGFLAFFEPFVERNPTREIEIVRSFQDGPWVFCNAYQDLNDGAARWVTTDMFYTDAEGKILEHWDTIASFVAETASGEDMVRGATEIDLTADTEASKALVLEYTKQVLQQGDRDKLAAFVAGDLIQRAPGIGPGRDGLADWLASEAAGRYDMLFKLIGAGDFVVTYGKRHAGGKDIAVFDIYRVSGGRIAEHWENAEEISPRENWGNSGKF